VMRDLVIATRNHGKLREIREILKEAPFKVLGLDAFPDAPEVDEDADSFAGNAEKKALTIADYTGCLTLADDSGLVVEALDGAPGVLSARFSGEDATDTSNNHKLLEMLSGVEASDRQAAFHCAMVLADPDGGTVHFSGVFKGVILEQMQGDGGFGYDPLFYVPDHGLTLAQLPLEIKNRISHRGQALRALLTSLQKSS
jgi:XTP/dITP diphosphohydrolase